MCIKTLELSLPEYQLHDNLNYDQIGGKLDGLVAENLDDGIYAERSIGVIDHPGKTVDELADIVKTHGTDKYDRTRRSIFDEEFSSFVYDIHASGFEVRDRKIKHQIVHTTEIEYAFPPESSYFGDSIFSFHRHALLDRGHSVRIGLIMIYDRRHLLPAVQVSDCSARTAKFSKYLFRFDGQGAKSALRCIVKLY